MSFSGFGSGPVIEIAGLPAAGKTTTAASLAFEFRDLPKPPVMIPEAARANPLRYKKTDFRFNVWSVCETLQTFLMYEERGLLIFDRGFVDALAWLRWYRDMGTIDGHTASSLESLILVPHWFEKVDLVLMLRTSFPVAVLRRGSEGKIVNPQVFESLSHAYDSVIHDLGAKSHPQMKVLNTDTASPEAVTQWALDAITSAIPELHGDR